MTRQGLRSNSEKSDELMNYLSGDEFTKLIASIVKTETDRLQSALDEVKNEVMILRESNIQLINLLTANNVEFKSLENNKNKILNTPIPIKPKAMEAAFSGGPEKSYKNICETVNLSHSADTHRSVHLKENKTSNKSTLNETAEESNSGENSSEKWVVKEKRKYRKLDVIKGNNKTLTEIKGATKYSHLHVYRLDPGMTTEHLINYIKSKNIPAVQCEKLRSRHPETYASFKVSVPEKYYEELMKPEMWPEEVRLNRFLQRLAPKNLQT